ncbi:GT4 family glycosyltransferase PelF [Fictibacillus sp. 7GRE50]|uniref:GT4 family glycosyltransferase PelF n=1 Tax=Fictibacillus sp. 7GRE50 TaxID=2745878 RepID=UPI0018CF3C99|nr:GT4 family glycosyltransferase PelF [Fictibacillus sp. 7GRE50]
MRIAIIAEGSYPFVSGGVSSWIHTLITEMPEFDFTIISIMPSGVQTTQEHWKYKLPRNGKSVKVYPLEVKEERPIYPHLNEENKKALLSFFMSKDTSGKALRFLGDTTIIGNPSGFFRSPEFWDIVQICYREEKLQSSFIDYFWMIRNKYEPILHLLQSEFDDYDILHAASTGYAGVLGAYLSAKQDIPLMVTEHGIYSREREEEILKSDWIPMIYKNRWIQFFYFLSHLAYNQAEQLITLFHKNAKIQERLGALKTKQLVVSNGVTLSDTSLKREYFSNDKPIQLGAIVRVVPIKDILTMIYAADMLRKKRILFSLQIFGPLDEDQEYVNECEQLVNELGLNACVTFTGKVDVQSKLADIDVLLLTSISEGQPLAILEGLAAGVPFVSTNVGDCEELITGGAIDVFGPAGFVVPPVNPRKVAESIENYVKEPSLIMLHGINGFNRVKHRYQLSEVINRYRSLYKEVGRVKQWQE